MPSLAQLQIHDNSAEAAPGEAIPDPLLLAQMDNGTLAWPVDVAGLKRTPDWAKPLLEAALALRGVSRKSEQMNNRVGCSPCHGRTITSD